MWVAIKLDSLNMTAAAYFNCQFQTKYMQNTIYLEKESVPFIMSIWTFKRPEHSKTF